MDWKASKVVIGESGGFEDDAFDDIGDVFAFVYRGFDDFEDFFPLDDLDGIFFLVEKLGDEGAAEAVALVFVAVDLDAVLEGFFRRVEGADGGFDFDRGGDEDLDEVHGAGANGIDTVQDEAAGGSVDKVNHVVKLAAK